MRRSGRQPIEMKDDSEDNDYFDSDPEQVETDYRKSRYSENRPQRKMSKIGTLHCDNF